MESRDKLTHIKVGDFELWTKPWGKKAALIANEGGIIRLLLILHKKMPDLFETLVDPAELCEEDLENTFTVIVDPEKVSIEIVPGTGRIGFTCRKEDEYECEE